MKESFTLIEVLVSVTILLTLSALSYPTLRDALIRAQVTKTKTDIGAIEKALYLYRVDNKSYPVSKYLPVFSYCEVDRIIVLTFPVSYLSPVPYLPWYGKSGIIVPSQSNPTNEMREFQYKNQMNYLVWITRKYDQSVESLNNSLPDWSISSGGPISVNFGSDPAIWYSPTNGLLSIGGFWRDSNGISSFNNIIMR